MSVSAIAPAATIVSGRLRLQTSQWSCSGRKPQNEDASSIARPQGPAANTKGVVALVADGVSHSAQPASQYCVNEFVTDYFKCHASWSTQNAIAQILKKINSALYYGAEKSAASKQVAGSNQWLSTTSGIILRSNTAHIFHIGDSQILRIRNGVVTRLTKPHNQNLANNTRLLTRAMGADNQLKVDYLAETIHANDIYILTTDGVHDFIDAKALLALVHATQNFAGLSEALVQLAKTNGSHDNLTCLAIRIDEVPRPQLDELQRALFSKKIPPPMQVGQSIDRFQVMRVLHESARSHVYEVKEKGTEKLFALKAPSENFTDDELYLQGFIREAWVGNQVVDAKIMQIFPNIPESPFLYHLCELVEGQTLRQWMLDHPAPRLAEVRKIIEQIATALRLLKRLEIIHRDLKPENLMISKCGNIKLIDFGAASIAALDENIAQIQDSDPQGTLNYIAPETLSNLTYTHQSDLFALGVIAYEMLTGKLPYQLPARPQRKKASHFRWHYRSALAVRPDLPFWLDLALRKAVDPDPAHRYEAYSQLIVDLARPNLDAEQAYLNRPLIERNPVKFWQAVSGILVCMIVVLLFKLSSG